jgi:hypothetical protein
MLSRTSPIACKTWRRRLLACAFLLPLLSGCVGIQIIETDSGRSKFLRSEPWREEILQIDQDQKVFRTLLRVDDDLLVRKLDFNGNVLESQRIPMIPGEGYGDRRAEALSPSGKTFAYFDLQTEWLHCRDVQSCQDSACVEIKPPREAMLDGMFFTDETHILVVYWGPNEGDSYEYAISTVDVSKKTLSVFYKLSGLHHVDVSYVPGVIAILESEPLYGMRAWIKVFDVASGEVLAVIREDGRFQAFSLSDDGTRIVYSVGHEIKIYDIKTGACSKICDYDEEEICFYLKFLDDNRIVYHVDTVGGRTRRLLVRDIHTGKLVKTIRADVSGEFYPVENGKKLLVPVGY